jgi:hypothetical protein
MAWLPWTSTLDYVDLALAMSPTEKAAAVLVLTAVAAPLVGLLLRRVAGGWDTIGKGPLAIEQKTRPGGGQTGRPAPLDPAVQAAEVRQMLEAKAGRLQRRGDAPIDVEAEARRLLEAGAPAPNDSGEEAGLRAEVRQLVISANERRLRRGEEPLDVEAETERRLEDFIGSS